MKIGRNDPCPCGSGLKYKKCCLVRDSMSVPIAPPAELSQMIQMLIENNHAKIQNAMIRAFEEVVANNKKDKEWENCQRDSDRILLIIAELKKSSNKILRRQSHSRQYLFILLRKAAFALYREIQNLPTRRKYSSSLPSFDQGFADLVRSASFLIWRNSPNIDPHEWFDGGSVEGINFTDLSIKEMEAVAAIFSLAELWCEARVWYRWACKGFKVFTTETEKELWERPDSDSVISYENRRNKYESLGGSAGVWYDSIQTTPLRPNLCGWLNLVITEPGRSPVLHSTGPKSNIRLKHLVCPLAQKAEGSILNGPLPPHLVPVPNSATGLFLGPIPYDHIFEQMSGSFEAALGVSSKELTAFLYSFYSMVSFVLGFKNLSPSGKDLFVEWTDESEKYRISMLKHWTDVGEMGLLRSSERDWVESLEAHSKLVSRIDPIVPILDQDKIRSLIHKFSFVDGSDANPNDPLLFIKLSKHTLAVDLFFVVDFLKYLLLQANLASKKTTPTGTKIGDITGPWLEDQATKFFVDRLNLTEKHIVRGDKIGRKRQIDLAFVYRRTLFVIECKAKAKVAAFVDGKQSIIRNRLSDFKEELTEYCPERARFIAEGRTNKNIHPSSFDKAYSMVCTAAVEYLPLTKTHLWSDGVPLVGPPEELLDSIKILAG